MSRKRRRALVAELGALRPDMLRVLLSTGKLVGVGFDHPPLDTLVLAMPVSWKGTLQQYAGRLHREHVSKADVRCGSNTKKIAADLQSALATAESDAC